ncbi:MAG: polysaccharide pyruvyl transferase family protein, partial [Thermacetogeniaceae bacterium]
MFREVCKDSAEKPAPEDKAREEGIGMLRVAVSGYYGFDNTGDEAILMAMVSTLKALAQNVEITVFSRSPKETSRAYGVKAVNRWNPFAVGWTLLRSDILLSGGGGLLQDVTGVRSIVYYLAVVAMAKLLGKTVVYYAQGVGPVRTRFGRWLTRLISNRVDLITVRDQASRDDLLAMGVNRPPLVVTADPVLAMSPQQIPR